MKNKKTMAKFEALCNVISSSINLLFLKSVKHQPVIVESTLSLIRSWLGNTADIARMSMKIFKGIKINKMVVQR